MKAQGVSVKRLSSWVQGVAGMLVCCAVGCGGSGASSAPIAPTAPTADLTPTITVEGSGEAPHELPFEFPVTATLGSTAQAYRVNTLLARLWSVVMPPVQAQITQSFALKFDFGLAAAQLPIALKVEWDFGDGSKATYGCLQTSATTLCDNIARSLSPVHTYHFQDCSSTFIAAVTITAGTKVVRKTFPVTLTTKPILALTSAADVLHGKKGLPQISGDIQVSWTLGACSSVMTIMPDVPWILRASECGDLSGGMKNAGEGCVGTSGKGFYSRGWSVTTNDSGRDRTGHINLSVAGGNSAVVTITQKGGDIPCSGAQFAQVGAAAYSAPKTSGSGGVFGFSVSNVGPSDCEENVAIGVSSSAAWLTYTPLSSPFHILPGSSGGTSGTFSFQENTTGSQRTATVTLTFSGGRPSFTWTVTQAGS